MIDSPMANRARGELHLQQLSDPIYRSVQPGRRLNLFGWHRLRLTAAIFSHPPTHLTDRDVAHDRTNKPGCPSKQ